MYSVIRRISTPKQGQKLSAPIRGFVAVCLWPVDCPLVGTLKRACRWEGSRVLPLLHRELRRALLRPALFVAVGSLVTILLVLMGFTLEGSASLNARRGRCLGTSLHATCSRC